MKKILFSVSLAAGLLLALPALGVYSAGMMGTFSASVPASANAQQMQIYMSGLQQGTLTPDQQKEMYSVMSSGNLGYKVMMRQPGPMMLGYGDGHQVVWFGLMFVFTVILVWVALLLLIAYLWHLVFSHHKH